MSRLRHRPRGELEISLVTSSPLNVFMELRYTTELRKVYNYADPYPVEDSLVGGQQFWQ